MRVLVRKWGNSASVTTAAHLSLDQVVDVREEDGRIVIEPALPEAVDLADLIAGISEDNLHAAIETGVPRGGEVW